MGGNFIYLSFFGGGGWWWKREGGGGLHKKTQPLFKKHMIFVQELDRYELRMTYGLAARGTKHWLCE